MAKTDRIIIISWFGKKGTKIININQTRKQVISNPEVFLESGSLKYCSKLQGEYKNSKSGAGTSVGPSLTTLGISLNKFLVTLSL